MDYSQITAQAAQQENAQRAAKEKEIRRRAGILELDEVKKRQSPGLASSSGALSGSQPKQDRLAKRPVLRTLRNIARAGISPMVSQPMTPEQKANPFYKDPADAFWAGMGQDVADAMLGINSGSHAMTMMNEARNMQPETQMQYLNYQVQKQNLEEKERQITISKAVELATTNALSVLDAADTSEVDPIVLMEVVGKQLLASDNPFVKQEGLNQLKEVSTIRGVSARSGSQDYRDDNIISSLLPRVYTQDQKGVWQPNPNASAQDMQDYSDAYTRRYGPKSQYNNATGQMNYIQTPAPTNLPVPSAFPTQDLTTFDRDKARRQSAAEVAVKGLDAAQTKRSIYIERMVNNAEKLEAIEKMQEENGQPVGMSLAAYEAFMAIDNKEDSLLQHMNKVLQKKVWPEIDQEYFQLGQDFILAILREESGAAIGASEAANIARLAFKTQNMKEGRQEAVSRYRSTQIRGNIVAMPWGWEDRDAFYHAWEDLYADRFPRRRARKEQSETPGQDSTNSTFKGLFSKEEGQE